MTKLRTGSLDLILIEEHRRKRAASRLAPRRTLLNPSRALLLCWTTRSPNCITRPKMSCWRLGDKWQWEETSWAKSPSNQMALSAAPHYLLPNVSLKVFIIQSQVCFQTTVALTSEIEYSWDSVFSYVLRSPPFAFDPHWIMIADERENPDLDEIPAERKDMSIVPARSSLRPKPCWPQMHNVHFAQAAKVFLSETFLRHIWANCNELHVRLLAHLHLAHEKTSFNFLMSKLENEVQYYI